ncbi:MAG: protein translocase subunit SecF [Dehalococcoidia bacterium]|nr:protein translocase subunit SecF [Dehalococcoidia bacterium]MDD5648405.1 protein translocase subunit SecF [Dehalococcoidia bacterium]
MIDIVGNRKWFFLISICLLVPGIISMLAFGFKLGIDFSSGTVMTLRFSQQVEQGVLRQQMAQLGYDDATIQKTSEGDFLVRTRDINSDEKVALIDGLEKGLNTDVTIRDLETVSPVVASEVARNAAIAVLVASIFMILYIAFAFRHMPSPFKWGFSAVIALLHDVLIVMGIFSILGWLIGYQVDSMFIVAMLTIVGFAINNTCVVYDRIRENVRKGISRDFAVTVNSSILETIARCVNTSLVVILTGLALFLFGGVTIQQFIMALLVGVLVGIYDSIFVAGPLLVLWDRGLKTESKAA